MSRWVAIFEDKPQEEAGSIREQHQEDHFAYLDENQAIIVLAGGLREEPGARIGGSLWVIEAATRAEAAALCEGDPFFKVGLRKAYRLAVWGKAPFYGDITL